VVGPWIMQLMSETPEFETEPTTSPVATAPPPPPVYGDRPAYVEPARHRPKRLFKAAAWVVIVAGSVFIAAVIFFTGFILGAHSGGGHHRHHHGHGMMHDQGPGMMPMRPSFIFPGGPGGPGGPGMFPGGPGQFGPGPGNFGPGQQQSPGSPQRPS
jgi:hypothetical protein